MKEAETTRIETGLRAGRRRRRSSRRDGPAWHAEFAGSDRMLERFLKDNAAGLTFLGITLGVFVSRKFLILPVAVACMLAQEKLVAAGLDRARRAVRR